MPHLILTDCSDIVHAAPAFRSVAQRWGRAVMKVETTWLRSDREALLVEGVVVEFSRALHPVAVVSPHHGNAAVRLWDFAPVERTEAVQRWLASVASVVLGACGGTVFSTNIPDALLQDLGLPR
jgi:hypothetical protein